MTGDGGGGAVIRAIIIFRIIISAATPRCASSNATIDRNGLRGILISDLEMYLDRRCVHGVLSNVVVDDIWCLLSNVV